MNKLRLHVDFSLFVLKGLGFDSCEKALVPIEDYGSFVNSSWTGTYGMVRK